MSIEKELKRVRHESNEQSRAEHIEIEIEVTRRAITHTRRFLEELRESEERSREFVVQQEKMLEERLRYLRNMNIDLVDVDGAKEEG